MNQNNFAGVLMAFLMVGMIPAIYFGVHDFGGDILFNNNSSKHQEEENSKKNESFEFSDYNNEDKSPHQIPVSYTHLTLPTIYSV